MNLKNIKFVIVGLSYAPIQGIGQGLALAMPWYIAQSHAPNQSLAPSCMCKKLSK